MNVILVLEKQADSIRASDEFGHLRRQTGKLLRRSWQASPRRAACASFLPSESNDPVFATGFG